MIQIERAALEDYGGLRQQWILHSLCGIHRPLDWGTLEQELRQGAKRILHRPGDIILSLDGPAIVPAMGLARLMNLPVIFATKANLARSPKLEFAEPMNPRPRVFIYGLRRKMTVILVDDAVITGFTLSSCIRKLQDAQITIRAVFTILESRKHRARERIRDLGCDLISLNVMDDGDASPC